MTEHRDAGWLAQIAEKYRQIQALQDEIADAREACPSIRLQDNFDAPLLALVNKEVARGFNRDAQIQALQVSLEANLRTAMNLERQNQALQAAYEDTRDSLMRALAALAEHDARYRQQVQAKAAEYHNLPGWP